MSHAMPEPNELSFDLSEGFSWYAVIKVNQQKLIGRKVIFEIGHLTTPLRLTIGLDESDRLRAWLIDADGKQFSTEPIPKENFFEKFVFARCEVSPPPGTGVLRPAILVLAVGDEYSRETTLTDANLGSNEPARYTIGSNLNGEENAAFDLAELILTERIQNIEERNKLRNYVRGKYKV